MRRVETSVRAMAADILDKAVLEVACGCGEFALCAAQNAASVAAIDLDDFRLLPEVRGSNKVAFQRMDATAMTYADGAFDTAVIYNAIGHLTEVLGPVLRECQRVLRPGGALYVVSSFSMDKAVIEDTLLPYLTKTETPFTHAEDKHFVYIRMQR